MAQRGRFIAVVGPSGVGKDSVMRAMAARRSDLHLLRRVITRDAEAGGEDFDSVSTADFDRMARAGAFVLHWRAHGLCYGIPAGVRQILAQGQDVLANLSRPVLIEAQEAFGRLVVLWLTARPEVLRMRLTDRGRETPAQIADRLARADFALPAGITATRIDNSGRLEATVDAALAALYPVRV